MTPAKRLSSKISMELGNVDYPNSAVKKGVKNGNFFIKNPV